MFSFSEWNSSQKELDCSSTTLPYYSCSLQSFPRLPYLIWGHSAPPSSFILSTHVRNHLILSSTFLYSKKNPRWWPNICFDNTIWAISNSVVLSYLCTNQCRDSSATIYFKCLSKVQIYLPYCTNPFHSCKISSHQWLVERVKSVCVYSLWDGFD